MPRHSSSASRLLPFMELNASVEPAAPAAHALPERVDQISTKAPFSAAAVSIRFEPRHGISDAIIQEALTEHRISTQHPIISKIIGARGFSSAEDLSNFIDPKESLLPKAGDIVGMNNAVEVLTSSIRSRSPVAIVCDYDVDGLSGAAQLNEMLTRLHVPVTVHIPDRINEGYGINDRLVNEIISSGAKVLVAIDLGSTSHRHIEALNTKNIASIILDHHEAPGRWPEAVAIVNPHQHGCALQDMQPCASAITWLTAREIIRREGIEALITPDELLPLAAIATLCDVVPLHAANRFLVKRLTNEPWVSEHAGLNALAAAFRESHISQNQFHAEDISYYLGPALNSASREGAVSHAWKILSHFREPSSQDALTHEAETLVTLNRQRSLAQKFALSRCHEAISTQGELGNAIVLAVPDISPGVIGLCAQTLSDYYARPAVIFTPTTEGLRGSVRSGPGNIDLPAILAACSDSVLSFGGHRAAAGVTIALDKLRTFSEMFSRALGDMRVGEKIVRVDAVATLAELTPGCVTLLQRIFEPSGSQSPTPVVVIKKVQVLDIEHFKKGVTILQLEQQGARGRAVCFKEELVANVSRGDLVDIVVEPRLDRYRNNQRAALRVQHVSRLHDTVNSSIPKADATPRLFDLASEPLKPSTPTERVREVRSPLTAPLQQPRFNFGDADLEEPNVYRVNRDGSIQRLNRVFPSPVPPSISELATRHNLTQLNIETFRSRAEQLKFLHFALSTEESLVCDADRGDGKTPIALALASRYLQEGKRVLYLAPTVELIDQVVSESRRLLTLDPKSIASLSGDLSPSRRNAIFSDVSHRLFIATAESTLNDIERKSITLGDFALVIFDEGHAITGRRASARIADHTVEAGIRRLILSGTIALSKRDLVQRIERLGSPLVFHLERGPRIREEEVRIIDRSPLEPTLAALNGLGIQALEHMKEVAHAHPSLDSMSRWIEKIHTREISMPSLQLDEIQEQMNLVRAAAEESPERNLRRAAGEIVSFGWQLGHIHQLAERTERYGIAMMLMKALETGYPMLFADHANDTPQYVQRLYRSGGTLRELLYRCARTDSLRSAFRSDLDNSERKTLFTGTHQTSTRTLSSELKRAVFDRCRSDLPKLTDIDHPKFEALLDITRDLRTDGILVYTGLVEHARFVAEALRHLDVNAGWFVGKSVRGKMSAGTGTTRKNALEDFRSGAIDTLIATSVADLGLDIKRLTHVVHWEPYQQNSNTLKQRDGRISRLDSETPGTTIKLALSGSDEQHRYQSLAQSAEARELWFTPR